MATNARNSLYRLEDVVNFNLNSFNKVIEKYIDEDITKWLV